uniref:Uncharacterized protein LOC111100476 isoform X2 n=1 Tax=Crassostrea virginica TaxID=6565 RepID=A0A8B8A9H5_CRAVI|nr:uncharacterized protein LOC111100476 isoform X2 [Crassostrea virginica]
MNMRSTSFVLLIFILCTPSVHTKGLLSSVILEAANSAVSLFTTISDLFQISTEKNELQLLAETLSELKHNLKIGLNSLLIRLEKSIYQNALTRYIDKINSCKKDYFNYVANPSDAAKRNLVKCSDIMESVRPLGNLLSGQRIFDSHPLFDLYKDGEGVCNGSAIESISKNLFADYVIGCTVASTIEAFENGVNTTLYGNECKDTISKVITYMRRLYSDCALPSCKTFHCSVQSLFGEIPPTSSQDLYSKLSEMYPWLNFLVFKLSKRGKVTAGGNFSIGHYDSHWINGYQYDIFFFDAYIQIIKESLNYSIAIEVPEELYDGHYFGNSTMTKIYFNGLTLTTFVGYASENNALCNDTSEYIRECHGTGTSNTLYGKVHIILIFVVLMYVL